VQKYYYFGVVKTILRFFTNPDFLRLRATGRDTSDEGYFGHNMGADLIDAATYKVVGDSADLEQRLLHHPNNSHYQLGYDGGSMYKRKNHVTGVVVMRWAAWVCLQGALLCMALCYGVPPWGPVH
jgi:hypothetical protein